ncbi:cobalt-precorrin 5B C1-methyltransferase [Halanaerobium congolense]|jgi:cobalt-precorrin-5B (C1)-methyltransferase|uniref:Cobalt-precorrin-5B C(1)-methyltransferase n=1 Tax=Halanaerobium congolense TaxID=54121 RepID=A0A1I0BY91_9FIRM|nr:cobalt-precorrin-5B (C(1))-methyltransferase CbiD [Halanaerobium congolense]PTX15387.1 cobalt-precorrin 5B C1-methyltransferase [Halanaerobium congolense]SDF86598.1 cobalt-precorrin 5B C1-methyltransferase [Halanaerobium congolense]SET11810.1 cobalt-precorrin 5B C1-methyltransferase [Halanaerobium congolense]SFP56483.1 cobalt-precorrin 5B C1-methyltransferase [Halanaerobium congolense]
MAFERYIKKGGKKYRLGYTTGTTAAGAAKAAALMLLEQKIVKKIIIKTPAEIEVEMETQDCFYSTDLARASVIKDAGDDPDQTDGIKIAVELKRIKFDKTLNKSKVILKGGKGIGKVTKPGLQLDVGQAAINPEPRKMIKKAVRDIFPEDNIFEVHISVPEGIEIAKKTFNPKLGIKDGISILGTTGIVEPMSESAYKESLAVELRQAAALGYKKLIFVFGNYGKKQALEAGFKEEQIIRMSNFVGFMLTELKELKIDEIIMVGHIGKIVKVAGGIFNTHSKLADGRREIIAAHAALVGADQKIIEGIFAINTAEEAADFLLTHNLNIVLQNISEAVVRKVEAKLENEINCKAVIFTLNQGIIALSKEAEEDFNFE